VKCDYLPGSLTAAWNEIGCEESFAFTDALTTDPEMSKPEGVSSV